MWFALIRFVALTDVFLMLYTLAVLYGPARVADRLRVASLPDLFGVVIIAALLSAMISL